MIFMANAQPSLPTLDHWQTVRTVGVNQVRLLGSVDSNSLAMGLVDVVWFLVCWLDALCCAAQGDLRSCGVVPMAWICVPWLESSSGCLPAMMFKTVLLHFR